MKLKLTYNYDPVYENAYWCTVSWELNGKKDTKMYCGPSFEDAKTKALASIQPLLERINKQVNVPPNEEIEINDYVKS